MFRRHRRESVIRIGDIGAERLFRAPRDVTRRKRAMEQAFPHGFQRAFPHGIPHALQHALQHGLQHALQHFPQFSTMFVRASFARWKLNLVNEIRVQATSCSSLNAGNC